MASEIHVTIIGKVFGNPETRTIGDRKVVKFSVSAKGSQKDPNNPMYRKSEWFQINVWGKQADYMADSVHHGDTVQIIGDLSLSTFVGKDGTPRHSLEVNADSVYVFNGVTARTTVMSTEDRAQRFEDGDR